MNTDDVWWQLFKVRVSIRSVYVDKEPNTKAH